MCVQAILGDKLQETEANCTRPFDPNTEVISHLSDAFLVCVCVGHAGRQAARD